LDLVWAHLNQSKDTIPGRNQIRICRRSVHASVFFRYQTWNFLSKPLYYSYSQISWYETTHTSTSAGACIASVSPSHGPLALCSLRHPRVWQNHCHCSFHVAARYDLCQGLESRRIPVFCYFAFKEFSEAASSPEPGVAVLQDTSPA